MLRLCGTANVGVRYQIALNARFWKGLSRMRQIDRFYPIVDSLDWVIRLVHAGARVIQLRMKDHTKPALRQAIRASLEVCRQKEAILVVNDHWQLAIDEGASWVHLGQEDLDSADVDAIRKARLKLGLSTHDKAEVARALALQPDYIALGPIYPTTIKAMHVPPQGLEAISLWKRAIGTIPLVAIGGITLDRAPSCIAAGADSVAVVTDILSNPDPESRCRAWLDALHAL